MGILAIIALVIIGLAFLESVMSGILALTGIIFIIFIWGALTGG